MKRRRFTKTEKRDIRDNASLILSGISTAVEIAALVIALNRSPSEEEYLYYSEIGSY